MEFQASGQGPLGWGVEGGTFQSTEALNTFLNLMSFPRGLAAHRHGHSLRTSWSQHFPCPAAVGESDGKVVRSCSGPGSGDLKVPHLCHFRPETLALNHWLRKAITELSDSSLSRPQTGDAHRARLGNGGTSERFFPKLANQTVYWAPLVSHVAF